MSQPGESYRTPPDAGHTPQEARAAQRRLPLLWIAVPLAIAVVIAIGFLLDAAL
jgi:hypothetical protein